MTAKVENYLEAQHRTFRSISIDRSERACINCAWYELYYRENRGNVQMMVPTCTGYCLLHEQQRGPLRQPCREYENCFKRKEVESK